MTFNAYETSVEDGRPIQFYRFSLGAAVWRYTNADEDLTLGGETWRAMAMRDDGVKQNGQATSETMNIDAPNTVGPAVMFMTAPPSSPIKAEVLRLHEGMTVPNVIYVGEVVQVNFAVRPGGARIACQTLSATMRRQGVRLGWQRTCPFALYDPMTCRVPKSSFAQPVTIESIAGFAISGAGFATHPDGYFNGGFIEWDSPIMGYRAITIEAHVGNQVHLFDDTLDIYPGLIIAAYPGCARNETACAEFGNIVNYGGFKSMPGKSPFDGIAQPMF